MRSRIDFGDLVNRPNILIGKSTLSRLGGSNTCKAANTVVNQILDTFTLEESLFHREKLARAGCNLGLSLLSAINLPDVSKREEKLRAVLSHSDLISTALYNNQNYGHIVFADSLKSLLEGYLLLHLYLKDSEEHTAKASEIVNLLSDILSLVTLCSIRSSGNSVLIGKLLVAIVPQRNLSDFVLGIDPSSTHTLGRKIESIYGEIEIDTERLDAYREVEKEIWQAPFWELYKLYQKAIAAIRAACISRISVHWNDRCQPKVLECLAIRADIRASLTNLQTFLLA